MNIRKATIDDLAEIGRLYDRVILYLNKHINYPHWTYQNYPCYDSAKKDFEADCLFVCEQEGDLVGVYSLNADPRGNFQKIKWPRSLQDGEYMIIHAMAVDVGLQQKGVGNFMMNHAIQYAKEQGFKAIRLDIVPGNMPSLKMCKRAGFQYVASSDLDRNMPEIPEFAMLEFVLDN